MLSITGDVSRIRLFEVLVIEVFQREIPVSIHSRVAESNEHFSRKRTCYFIPQQT
jgi:hypothetical protein